MSAVDTNVAALLALTIAANTVQKLTENGVLNDRDGFEVYERSIANLTDPREKAEAKKILKALMPGLIITDTF